MVCKVIHGVNAIVSLIDVWLPFSFRLLSAAAILVDIHIASARQSLTVGTVNTVVARIAGTSQDDGIFLVFS